MANICFADLFSWIVVFDNVFLIRQLYPGFLFVFLFFPNEKFLAVLVGESSGGVFDITTASWKKCWKTWLLSAFRKWKHFPELLRISTKTWGTSLLIIHVLKTHVVFNNLKVLCLSRVYIVCGDLLMLQYVLYFIRRYTSVTNNAFRRQSFLPLTQWSDFLEYFSQQLFFTYCILLCA